MRFFRLNLLGKHDADLCFLDNFIEGIQSESWRAGLGEALTPIYPQDARIHLSEKSPGIKLASFLGNTRGMLPASTSFKEAIELHCAGQAIEYLPFTLYDHRGRVHSRDYFLVNPLGSFDCLDFQASDIAWDKERPGEILDINQHVLERQKMKDAPQLFRVARDPHTYVIGLELAREMQKRGLTNVILKELKFSDSQ